MAHFAILSPPAAGHLTPLSCLGLELRSLGHRVTVVARARAAPLVRRAGLAFRELPLEGSPRYHRPPLPLAAVAALLGKQAYLGLRARFRYWAECILTLTPGILEELAVDGLVVDQNVVAGGSVAERMGLPFVTVSSGFAWNGEADIPPVFTGWTYSRDRWSRLRNRLGHAAMRAYMRPAIAAINRRRLGWGMPALRHVEQTFSPLAQIAQGCASFDYPRRSLARTFHYVGSLTTDRPSDETGFPWERLDDRPLVYACLGTVGDRRNRITLRKIAFGCADLDSRLLISRGAWTAERAHRDDDLSDLPGAPLVMDYVPQAAVLRRTALLISHAGLNTVMESLASGVPMVALPRGADQPALAARVEYAGVGLRASFRGFSPEQLRRLAHRVLTDPSYRDNARRMQRHFASAGGVRRAARVVEQALTTGRPVEVATRSEV